MTDDVSYTALAAPSRRLLLQVLRNAAEPVDLETLAEASGLHVNTVRFHVGVLVEAGLATEHTLPRHTRGRPRVAYRATVPAEATEDGYRVMAGVLASYLDQLGDGALAERAGREWAHRLTPAEDGPTGFRGATRRIVALLHQMGFAPEPSEVDDSEARVLLRGCPFRSLATAHPGVVCAMHRGVLRGTLDRLAADDVRVDLHPFVEPELCAVALTTKAAG